MGDLTRNFNKSEVACKHCGKYGTNQAAIDILQKFRDNINKPVNVYSAYRCPVNNQAVGGAKNSFHVLGMAFDINVKGVTYADMVWLANQIGCKGIGIYPDEGFVHIDIGGRKACWVKYQGKDYQYMSYEQLMNRPEMKQILK